MMRRLSGRPSAAWPYDKALVLQAWLFCRAFALLGMPLPRFRGNARALALDAAVTARRLFRTIRQDAAPRAGSLEATARVAILAVSRDLEAFFEWLMTLDEQWLARLRRCRGCHRYFWQESQGTSKEHHAPGCRVKALRARRRLSDPL